MAVTTVPNNSLPGLSAVGIVDNHTSSKPRPHSLVCNEFHLSRILRIELKHSTRTSGLWSVCVCECVGVGVYPLT